MARNLRQDNKAAARSEAAEMLAIAALSFLAAEPEHLGRFLAVTGVDPSGLRAAARDRGFLSGVLDYFSSEEPLLLAFAQQQGVDPAEIERARGALGGLWERDVP